MATVHPFQALRYNPAKINGPLASVVAPPYDVISLEDQEALYRKSPHNVIRLILNRQFDGDGPGDNRYTRAAKTLEQWIEAEVLVQDAQPSFYVYEQDFTIAAGTQSKTFTRRGVLVALKLEPFGEGSVYPHEETFSSHKADRLSLIRATRANLSPIFGLAPDTGKTLHALLKQAASGEPNAAIREDSGVMNRMWVIEDPKVCAQIAAACAAEKVFIADGHHRYETACTYANERRKTDSRPGVPGPRGYDFCMMMLVPMTDPGLHILPTHRLVHAPNGFEAASFKNKLGELFEIRPATDAELIALSEDEAGPVRYGLVLAGGEKLLVTAKPGVEAAMGKVAAHHSTAWRGLDVAILHELILKNLVGLGDANNPHKHNIHYTREPREALQLAKDFHFGIVMRPTRMDQVVSVSETGERMPQKSTYFYPKLLSGLVFRKV